MEQLKEGMTFEVVEWLGDGDYRVDDIGFQSIIEEEMRNGEVFIFGRNDFILATQDEIKKIGRLKITKVK